MGNPAIGNAPPRGTGSDAPPFLNGVRSQAVNVTQILERSSRRRTSSERAGYIPSPERWSLRSLRTPKHYIIDNLPGAFRELWLVVEADFYFSAADSPANGGTTVARRAGKIGRAAG